MCARAHCLLAPPSFNSLRPQSARTHSCLFPPPPTQRATIVDPSSYSKTWKQRTNMSVCLHTAAVEKCRHEWGPRLRAPPARPAGARSGGRMVPPWDASDRAPHPSPGRPPGNLPSYRLPRRAHLRSPPWRESLPAAHNGTFGPPLIHAVLFPHLSSLLLITHSAVNFSKSRHIVFYMHLGKYYI
jgi:hypothetical protein